MTWASAAAARSGHFPCSVPGSRSKEGAEAVQEKGKASVPHLSMAFLYPTPRMSKENGGPSVSSTIKGSRLHVALKNKIKIGPFALKMSNALSS